MDNENHMTPEENIKKLASLIKDIKFAMVTTVDKDGKFHSCPLTTQHVEFDGDLWFLVKKTSEVYKNIEADSRVNVNYTSEKAVYISATGEGHTVENRALLEKIWNPAYKIWFEQGVDDPNIGLIEITVDNAEYWESPGFAVGRMLAFAKAFITKDKNSLGEHHKINLN